MSGTVTPNPTKTLLIDPPITDSKGIQHDQFTVRAPTFNEIMRARVTGLKQAKADDLKELADYYIAAQLVVSVGNVPMDVVQKMDGHIVEQAGTFMFSF